jgi:hypothetical protein
VNKIQWGQLFKVGVGALEARRNVVVWLDDLSGFREHSPYASVNSVDHAQLLLMSHPTTINSIYKVPSSSNKTFFR